MIWTKKSVKDEGGFWTDHLSEDGHFIVAQGYNEYERKLGKPWALFECKKESSWVTLGFFENPEEAKTYLDSLSSLSAESLAQESPTAQSSI